jgi:hypothetical protein
VPFSSTPSSHRLEDAACFNSVLSKLRIDAADTSCKLLQAQRRVRIPQLHHNCRVVWTSAGLGSHDADLTRAVIVGVELWVAIVATVSIALTLELKVSGTSLVPKVE